MRALRRRSRPPGLGCRLDQGHYVHAADTPEAIEAYIEETMP
jgi:hypothetical protein